MLITPLGDSALVVHLCDGFEDDAQKCLRAVRAAVRRIEAAELPAINDIAPAFTTVGVFFDPARVMEATDGDGDSFEILKTRITSALRSKRGPREERVESRVIEIPVCYDREFGLDLRQLAERAGIAAADIVSRHAAATYHVRCIGFTPGFPYLSGLPPELATPRRATPRKSVPAGSLAIGGMQTGIYPLPSPGGWNIIGRTPLRMFDPARVPPALLAIGDRVRFQPITRAEFDAQAS